MFKPVTITFRTSRELREMLDRIGQEAKRSRSSLIEMILSDFISRRKGIKGIAPPSPHGGDREEMKYIDLGGVRIALPKDLPLKIFYDESVSAFQIDFHSREGDLRGQNDSREAHKPENEVPKVL